MIDAGAVFRMPEDGGSEPMAEPGRGALRFGAFAVDLDAAEITRDGQPVRVEPQVFDLIVLLCTNAGRVVGHDEIIEKVWHGRVVSDSAVASRINAARKALGDDGTAQRVIRTVRGRGFRFEPRPVRETARTDPAPAPGWLLSATPHGYALLMATRAGAARGDWRETLPGLLARVAGEHQGSARSAGTATFDDAARALACAGALLDAVARHGEDLPAEERWNVKVGVAPAGGDAAGERWEIAGRLDAAACPGGLCITREVLAAAAGWVELEARPLDAQPGLADVDALEVTQLGGAPLVSSHGAGPSQLTNLQIPEPGEVSIAVLPFETVGGDSDLAALAVGLRLEFQNALAQLSGVLPVAAGSAMAFEGAASPVAAASLGVRYVLQGNVRAIERRMRLMLELYDHHRGGVAWSHSYDGSLDEGFEFQDHMTRRVVTALDVKILSGEQARVWHGEVPAFQVIQIQYRGMRDFFGMTRECMRAARAAFERVHALCPNRSMGATWVTLCHWFELQRGWADDVQATRRAAKRWARLATAREDADGQAHTALCHVHVMSREFDQALAVGARAVEVRPSCANANGFYAHALYHCGELERAIHHAKLAIRFTPVYPPLFGVVLAGALHARGDHEGAIPVAKEMLRLAPRDVHARVILCSALMHAGREEEACARARELERIEPGFQAGPFLERMPLRRAAMRRQLDDGSPARWRRARRPSAGPAPAPRRRTPAPPRGGW